MSLEFSLKTDLDSFKGGPLHLDVFKGEKTMVIGKILMKLKVVSIFG